MKKTSAEPDSKRPQINGRWQNHQRWSLRSRLTALTAGVVLTALAVGALSLTAVIWQNQMAALDETLTQRAEQIAILIGQNRVPAVLPVAEPGEIVQVVDLEGAVIATSTGASLTLPALSTSTLVQLRGTGPATVVSSYDKQARALVEPATYQGTPVSVVVTLPLGEIQSLMTALRWALCTVVPVLTGISAGLVWVLIGAALRPVERLRQAAAQIAAAGGRDELPVPAQDDEIAALARTLNDMLHRLQIAAARQRVFVADAAHELRTPVASLRAAVEVAQAHPQSTTKAELLAELTEQVIRLQHLIDDLLVLAQVGAEQREPAELDLRQVVLEATRMLAALEVTVTGEGVGWGQHQDMVRVVRNLLENAQRFATQVQVTVSDGQVLVDDDGPGIAPGDRERVFARFVRLDDIRDRDAGGAGLGLAIVRELVQAQNGHIDLEASPSGGLRAVVRLPNLMP